MLINFLIYLFTYIIIYIFLFTLLLTYLITCKLNLSVTAPVLIAIFKLSVIPLLFTSLLVQCTFYCSCRLWSKWFYFKRLHSGWRRSRCDNIQAQHNLRVCLWILVSTGSISLHDHVSGG